jgi:hypothetical protein
MSIEETIHERLCDALVCFRLPRSATLIYVTLLRFGPHTRQAVLQRRIVPVEEVDGAIAVLQSVLLIGEQRYRHKIRYYATNPSMAWRWQELRFIWDRVLTLVPVDDVPQLGDHRDQERLALLRALRTDAMTLYERRRHNVSEDGRGRVLTTDREYAQACAEIICLAGREIIAVDKPPHATATLPVFWSAITDRRAAGVAYRRCVPFEEMLVHGLDVIARDIREVGVDLQIVDSEWIRQCFYLVDGKYLVIKFAPRDTNAAVARLSFDRHKIQRFREMGRAVFAKALPAGDILPAAWKWAERIASGAARQFGTRKHEDVALEIARMGKFAEFAPEDRACIADLLSAGVIRSVEQDRYALTEPAVRSLAALASFR